MGTQMDEQTDKLLVYNEYPTKQSKMPLERYRLFDLVYNHESYEMRYIRRRNRLTDRQMDGWMDGQTLL